MVKYIKNLANFLILGIILLTTSAYLSRSSPKPPIREHYVIINNLDINEIQAEINKTLHQYDYQPGDTVILISTIPDEEYIDNLLTIYQDDNNSNSN